MPAEDTRGDIDAEVARVLTQRLLDAAFPAELAHVVLAAVVAAFLIGYTPAAYAVLWAAAVAAVGLGRTYWRQRALRAGQEGRLARRGVRIGVTVSSALWGLGAAWLTLHAPFDLIALMLVVLAGLVAGAMVTLMPDPPAFRLLLANVLGFPAVGLVAGGLDRVRGAAVVLMVVFGVFEAAVHRRGYLVLLGRERARVQVIRAEEAARQSEAKYRSLVEHAVQGIYRSTVDGRLVAVNSALVGMLGYGSADELLRRYAPQN